MINIPGITGLASIITSLDAFNHSFTVTPEILQQKLSALLGKINEMHSGFEELENIVEKTKTYWLGEAGDAHRDFYEKEKPEIEIIFKRWMENVEDLNQIAETYSKAEQEVKEIASDLPADVIV